MEAAESNDALVPPSLRALLDDILDYEGLFPPAELSLSQALHNYADYRTEPKAWLLSRFVLPVRQLPDLPPYRSLLSRGAPYRFSVLGTGGDDPETFLDRFVRDLDVLDAFDAEFGGRSQVDRMEIPLPDTLVGAGQTELESFFSSVDRRLVQTGTAKLDLFLRVPTRPASVERLPALCAAVAEHNSRQALPARSEMGLKLRCGGGTPEDVPSAQQVAALIVACRDAGIAFKATSGLQRPVRHYDDALDTEMHGFLNLFAGAVLAAEHQLDRDVVETILLEETSSNFRFKKESFSWRNLGASLEGIRHARESLALSFGSCSFEDPIDNLRDLDLL